MKVSTFDRNTCKITRFEIEEALKPVAKKLGISIKTGRGTFDPNGGTFDLALNMGTVGTDGIVASKVAADFIRFAEFHNLNAADLGKEFYSHSGERFRITGLSVRSKKYPILAEKLSDGKGYKFPADAVVLALKQEVTI